MIYKNKDTYRLYSHDYGEFLKKHGFKLLTGEACNIGMRVLTDMNDVAAGYMAGFLGIDEPNFNAPANNGKGSIMLDRRMTEPLCKYILEQYGWEVSVGLHNSNVGRDQLLICVAPGDVIPDMRNVEIVD